MSDSSVSWNADHSMTGRSSQIYLHVYALAAQFPEPSTGDTVHAQKRHILQELPSLAIQGGKMTGIRRYKIWIDSSGVNSVEEVFGQAIGKHRQPPLN
jgi:hypothetical protein